MDSSSVPRRSQRRKLTGPGGSQRILEEETHLRCDSKERQTERKQEDPSTPQKLHVEKGLD